MNTSSYDKINKYKSLCNTELELFNDCLKNNVNNTDHNQCKLIHNLLIKCKEFKKFKESEINRMDSK